MPRNCSICIHPKRLQIEKAILNGTTLRTIADLYGPSKTAVLRHKPHAADSMARHSEARDFVRSGALLDDVRAGEGRAERLYQNAEEILTAALQDKDRRGALQAIRVAVSVMAEARGYLELRGELTSELGRDRTPAMMSIQVICPATMEKQPRISYAAEDEFEMEVIGLRQLR